MAAQSKQTSFDMMKSGYDIAVVEETIKIFTNETRNTYLFIQMPIDFIYPIIMAMVMIFVFVKTTNRYRIVYFLLPAVFALFDWVENLCIILFLTAASIAKFMVGISSFCTQGKALLGDYILYYGVIVYIIIYVLRKLITYCKSRDVKKT